MSIEIQGPRGHTPADLTSNAASNKTSNKHDGGEHSLDGGRDSLSLTDQALQVRALESQVAGLPVIDTKRVTEVQQAIADNELHINPHTVADKILQFETSFHAR